LIEMSSDARPPANRMTLQTFKARLGGAKKGWSLLKKKRDALKTRFMALLNEIVETKLAVGEGLNEAGFSLAKAQWAMAGDDITATVVERAKMPSCTCKLTADNCAGVSIPKFTMVHDPSKDTGAETLGVSHGGAVVQACRMEYLKAVMQLVRLASLQTAFKTLDEEIKMTSRRVNALEYVLIPKMEDVCRYIILEMDEESREEFFRVKKVVEKKRAKLMKERLNLLAEETAKGLTQGKKIQDAAFDAPSALPGKKDADVVF